jgi:hypothetical protein
LDLPSKESKEMRRHAVSDEERRAQRAEGLAGVEEVGVVSDRKRAVHQSPSEIVDGD